MGPATIYQNPAAHRWTAEPHGGRSLFGVHLQIEALAGADTVKAVQLDGKDIRSGQKLKNPANLVNGG